MPDLRKASAALWKWVGSCLLIAGTAGAQYGAYDQPTGIETGWTPRNQFLLRPNTAMGYDNFGAEAYRERGSGFDWYPAFDRMGEPWLSGSYTAFEWIEDRSRAPQFGSQFTKSLGRHNNLIIAKENYKNGTLRLSVGEAVRTTFTSLTLDLARFTGVRADAVLGQNHELTMLLSRSSDPLSRLGLIGTGTPLRNQGTILSGGHWEGRFLRGGLFLGATLVNNHRFDSLQESGDFLRGTMAVEINPDTVVVRIADDSPVGGNRGAAIYGSRMGLTLRRGPGENWLVQGIRPVVVASDGARWVDDHWEVEGQAYLEEVVPMPGDAVGMQVRSTVAQDYRISTRQVHRALNRTSVQQEIRHTPLVTRRRAGGNGPDGAQEFGFDYGLSSATDLAGFDGKLAVGTLNLEWEYARSIEYFQFPVAQIGGRSSYTGEAYYVRGTQAWWKLLLGGEYFSLSPKYSSYALDTGDFRKGDLHVQSSEDFIALDYMGNDFSYYFNDPQPNTLKGGSGKRNRVIALVDDNDDNDQYEDQSGGDEPITLAAQPLDSGVYPGWDLDRDGVPDYNRNRNSIPDYLEPFFKYGQEEQVFYWGDDLNNNGVLDYFEDDSLPDYPYAKDERGPHLFLNWTTPLRGLSLRVGTYRIDQIAGPGQNHVDYLAGSYRRVFPGRARLQWEHELRRVEDDIPNPVFQYRLIESRNEVDGRYESIFVDDSLAMRHSLVERGYLGTQWMPVRDLLLHNNLRYELNHQRADEFTDGAAQKSADLNTLALVNKIDYTSKWKRLTLRPMFKHTLLKQDLGGGGTGPGGVAVRKDVTEIVPIFRTDCRLTDRTSLELGAEGFPFFKERFVDRENKLLDFSSQTYLAQLKRKGLSGGFNVFITMGFQYTKKEFDEPNLPSGSFVRSFFQVFIGEQILAAAQ